MKHRPPPGVESEPLLSGRSAAPEPLAQRLEREAQFHDQKYSGGDRYPRHYALVPTQHVYRKLRRMMGNISGQRVLEYGCGEGWITLDLARTGARVWAFDISEQAIENTRQILDRENLAARCTLEVMAAESLAYADASFDMAVGFAIIHHLDLGKALTELHRVLRPGGVAFFAEPLATNPAIQLYRYFTPHFRTADERPLRLDELPRLLAKFSSFEHQEVFLTAVAALGLAHVPGGARVYPAISARFHRLDELLLSRMPGLGKWAWYTVLKIAR